MKPSLLLFVLLLVLAGCQVNSGQQSRHIQYTNQAPSAEGEELGWTVRELPDKGRIESLTQYKNFSIGGYALNSHEAYSLDLAWQEGGTIQLYCIGQDDYKEAYTVTSGQPALITVPQSGVYHMLAPLDGSVITQLTYSLSINSAQPDTSGPKVVYDMVEMRRYTGENAHPYVYSVVTNHTDKKITGNQFGMLAYDQNGAPLKIRWNPFDPGFEPSFYFLCHWGSSEIEPGETDDIPGGWSLNFDGTDSQVDKISYVLYCDKEITFEDGTIWSNPGFETWRKEYEGKQIDVAVLERYYPFEQNIGLESVVSP